MNYFTHALPHLDDPYFVAGTALPDWLSVVDRRLRLRERMLQPHCESSDPITAALARGASRHLADDHWFHVTQGFTEVTAAVGAMFRERLGGSDGFRCGFLGHITTELLLDGVLAARYPRRLDQYYDLIGRVDSERIADLVGEWTGETADGVVWFVRLFQREHILRDYNDNHRLWLRLNTVLRRVKLTPLPEAARDGFSEARDLVDRRATDLLPFDRYPWP